MDIRITPAIAEQMVIADFMKKKLNRIERKLEVAIGDRQRQKLKNSADIAASGYITALSHIGEMLCEVAGSMDAIEDYSLNGW